jgi:hypothetical protein
MKKLLLLSLIFLVGPAYGEEAVPPASSPTLSPTTAPASEPFAFGDFTWLNGNNRQKTALLDTPYFTGSFLVDTNYIYDFNRPVDHTLIGSTSAGRTGEFELQQLGIGGDFHYQHARGRVMTQFGMYSTMTPRNDGSPARGQWDLADAYRYVSEAYGGYHWDIWHGINLDAGLFMSYVGLFSYYNVENWAYQASYVSANTPWFFNGLRLQTFPTDRLKVELWFINGWQSYGMFNEMPGLGYQILYRPNERVAWVFNGYGGDDTQDHPGRARFHSDNSFQYKYLDHPAKILDKAAFSFTFDVGCENGSGVSCTNGTADAPTQNFLGFMVYNRLWFKKDIFAMTVGGGAMTNPGRYLVLLPPTQTGSGTGPLAGASATNNTCAGCFDQSPGDHFNAWDASLTFDYMPDQFVTFRAEYDHREADVPYFAGEGGITSPDGYNTSVQPTGWTPDYRNDEDRINLAMMVRF